MMMVWRQNISFTELVAKINTIPPVNNTEGFLLSIKVQLYKIIPVS